MSQASGNGSGRPSASRAQAHAKETPKETLISVIMSFALVFVFTRFVAATYVIPTGSMAPTLMGAHLRFWSDETGVTWATNPWEFADQFGRTPLPVEGTRNPISPDDPITGQPLPPQSNVPLRSGDRIFVMNYIDGFSAPRRWDVVVFKFPGDATENYIKRLVGMPGEDVWLADGDVFTRPASDDLDRPLGDGWTIQRKPDAVQRALWYTLYSSELRPLHAQINGRPWRDRWTGAGWSAEGVELVHDDATPAVLRWDSAARPIDDWVSYNNTPAMNWQLARFPVSDLRMRAGVRPGGPGLEMDAILTARGHEFVARLRDGRASLLMRQKPDGSPDRAGGEDGWRELAGGAIAPLTPGRVVDVEFWHADQALELWINGARVLRAAYDWGPVERLRFALKPPFTGTREVVDPERYRTPEVRWVFSGAPVRLERVGLDRDIAYQPVLPPGKLARAVWPEQPLRLGPDQFFPLGDNSAASGDGRAWDSVDPWVAAQIDDTRGVVPRELMLGKAFFVFWPSTHRWFVPDFGRLRWIK